MNKLVEIVNQDVIIVQIQLLVNNVHQQQVGLMMLINALINVKPFVLLEKQLDVINVILLPIYVNHA